MRRALAILFPRHRIMRFDNAGLDQILPVEARKFHQILEKIFTWHKALHLFANDRQSTDNAAKHSAKRTKTHHPVSNSRHSPPLYLTKVMRSAARVIPV